MHFEHCLQLKEFTIPYKASVPDGLRLVWTSKNALLSISAHFSDLKDIIAVFGHQTLSALLARMSQFHDTAKNAFTEICPNKAMCVPKIVYYIIVNACDYLQIISSVL